MSRAVVCVKAEGLGDRSQETTTALACGQYMNTVGSHGMTFFVEENDGVISPLRKAFWLLRDAGATVEAGRMRRCVEVQVRREKPRLGWLQGRGASKEHVPYTEPAEL